MVGNYYFKIRILSRTLNGFFSLFFFFERLQVIGLQPESPTSYFEEVNILLLSQASKHSM